MKIPPYRTFARNVIYLDDYKTEAELLKENYRPQRLMRKMAENPEFESFKYFNKKASLGHIRLHFAFPKTNPDKIVLTISDRRNPTPADIMTFIANLFRSKYSVEPLPTMSREEFIQFFKDALRYTFMPKTVNKFPVKTVEFDPSKPYMEKLGEAFRAFCNERLFGVAKK